MTDNNELLKPCPFCGGEPSINEIEAHAHVIAQMPDCPGYFYIECAPCDMRRFGDTKEQAIDAWNTRHCAQAEELRARNAMLIDACKPLVEIVLSSSGRIPTERLSFANWHDMARAFSATQQDANALIAEVRAKAECDGVKRAMELLLKHGEDHDWRIMAMNMGSNWADLRASATQPAEMKRYNFDRYRGIQLMAQGIAVHAASLEEATRIALSLRDRPTEIIKFTDNTPCGSWAKCPFCSVQPEGKGTGK